MNTTPGYDRIEALTRREGMQHSLYMGEAIGNMLAIAWNAFGALGAWLRPKPQQRRPNIWTA